MAPACLASDKGKRQQEKGIHSAWNGLSNGTTTGVDEILESVQLMDYKIGILGNWKKTGSCMKHIVTRENGENGSSTKFQRGANMDQEDKELDWPTIGCEMRRL